MPAGHRRWWWWGVGIARLIAGVLVSLPAEVAVTEIHPVASPGPRAAHIVAGRHPAERAPMPQDEPPVRLDFWRWETVVDWQNGYLDRVQISNNEGGELRLVAGHSEGCFLSRPFSTTFAVNAVGGFWRAVVPMGTTIILEIRGRSTPPTWSFEQYEQAIGEEGWGPWQQLIAGDARSRSDDGALASPDVLALPPDTHHLQVRVQFRSSIPRVSAVLNALTVAGLNTMQGPRSPSGLPRTPIMFGPEVDTPRPLHLLRTLWSGQRLAIAASYARPRSILIHQVEVLPGVLEMLPLLRAQATYQKTVLGWDDLAYHYLIDPSGYLYEGRVGGPTSYSPYFSGGDHAVHIALLGNRSEKPAEAALNTLIGLLAWLGQAYAIPPTGSHPIGDTAELRANILVHQRATPEASDSTSPLLDLLPTIREQADRATIRSRWFFPEGNVRGYQQQFVFFNPNPERADTLVKLYPSNREPTELTLTIAAWSQHVLLVNDVITGTDGVSAIVEANRQIIVERSMETETDLSITAGIPELSRVWYFAEASTDGTFNTYLILFNPHPTFAEAEVTYMRGDGKQVRQQVHIPPQQRMVVTVNDALPGYGFGMKVVADRPLAAERTMRFGPGGRGMHTGPGIAQLSRSWYFAEGTTDPPFTMRLLVLNPNVRASNIAVTFMTPDGTTLQRNYVVPPTTRFVVNVNEVVPTLGVATTVTSELPVAVERALYFDPKEVGKPPIVASRSMTSSLTLTTTEVLVPEDAVPMAGTVSSGAIQPAYVWRFAYGRSLGAREYVLLSNPGPRQARVTVITIYRDGLAGMQHIVMPANSRYTLAVHDFPPQEELFSTIIQSTQPVVAERSLFMQGRRTGGTTSPGVPGS